MSVLKINTKTKLNYFNNIHNNKCGRKSNKFFLKNKVFFY